MLRLLWHDFSGLQPRTLRWAIVLQHLMMLSHKYYLIMISGWLRLVFFVITLVSVSLSLLLPTHHAQLSLLVFASEEHVQHDTYNKVGKIQVAFMNFEKLYAFTLFWHPRIPIQVALILWQASQSATAADALLSASSSSNSYAKMASGLPDKRLINTLILPHPLPLLPPKAPTPPKIATLVILIGQPRGGEQFGRVRGNERERAKKNAHTASCFQILLPFDDTLVRNATV